MAAKPDIEDTRWAIDGADADAANIAEPDGTLKDEGYEDDAVPTAKNWNWIKNRAHRWFQYLSDGDLDGDVAVAGDVTVTGQFTVLAGDAVIDGDLTVQNITTLQALLEAQAGVNVTGNISLASGHLNPTQIRTLQFGFSRDTNLLAPFAFINNAHQFVTCSVDIPLGWTIDSVRVHVKDNATGAQTLGAQLESWTLAPASTADAMGVTNGSGAVQILTTATGLGHVVVAGQVWVVAVFYNGGAATQTCLAGIVEVDVLPTY